MNKEALIKDLNEVYNLVSDHDITEAMERLEFVIREVKQLRIGVVSNCLKCNPMEYYVENIRYFKCKHCGKEMK